MSALSDPSKGARRNRHRSLMQRGLVFVILLELVAYCSILIFSGEPTVEQAGILKTTLCLCISFLVASTTSENETGISAAKQIAIAASIAFILSYLSLKAIGYFGLFVVLFFLVSGLFSN
jgi:hypothetical protein